MSNLFFKIKSLDYFSAAILLKQMLPELNKSSVFDIEEKLREQGKLSFYQEGRDKVPFWIRLTFPFAILFFILLLISLPLKFIITGSWKYGDWQWAVNWFRALKLVS